MTGKETDQDDDGPAKFEGRAPDYRVDPVPKVPHGFRGRWAVRDIIRIAFLLGLLSLVLLAREPCASSVANFVEAFEEPDAGPAKVDPRSWKLERLTPEQIKARHGGNTAAGAAEPDAGPKAPASLDETEK